MSEKNENLREFDLSAILTITTKKMLTDIDNIYDILNYLSGDELWMHQLARVSREASSYILELYPQLDEIKIVDGQIKSKEEAQKFVAEQKRLYGDTLALSPMPKGMHESVDPVEEIIQLRKRR